MFGTLRPHRCALSPDTRVVHQRLYCGLCKTLGDDYGQLSRALVSHDAVLMGAIVEALSDTSPPTASCRCPLNPLAHRPTFAPDSVPMQFAAATQVLLADQWLADRATEGRGLAWALRPLGRRAVRQASAALSALGAAPHLLADLETQQQQLESTSATPTPRQAAQPTAQALSTAFSWAGHAPGTVPLSASAQQALSRLGAAVGETIYAIDALEDLEADLRTGAFNPCIQAGRPDAQAIEACGHLLAEAHRTTQEALSQIPWRRDRELLDNVLLRQQGQRAHAALLRARRQIQQVPPTSLERLLAFFATLWLWIFSSSSPPPAPGDDGDLPQERRRRGRKRRRQQDSDGGFVDTGSSGCDCTLCCTDALCCSGSGQRRSCGDVNVPGPCDLDCCPCDGDGCGCQPDCCPCDCG